MWPATASVSNKCQCLNKITDLRSDHMIARILIKSLVLVPPQAGGQGSVSRHPPRALIASRGGLLAPGSCPRDRDTGGQEMRKTIRSLFTPHSRGCKCLLRGRGCTAQLRANMKRFCALDAGAVSHHGPHRLLLQCCRCSAWSRGLGTNCRAPRGNSVTWHVAARGLSCQCGPDGALCYCYSELG